MTRNQLLKKYQHLRQFHIFGGLSLENLEDTYRALKLLINHHPVVIKVVEVLPVVSGQREVLKPVQKIARNTWTFLVGQKIKRFRYPIHVPYLDVFGKVLKKFADKNLRITWLCTQKEIVNTAA